MGFRYFLVIVDDDDEIVVMIKELLEIRIRYRCFLLIIL